MQIEEFKNAHGYSDISNVVGWLVEPYVNKAGVAIRTESWTCFSNHYPVGKEREFIETVEQANPGKFTHYCIHWHGCN